MWIRMRLGRCEQGVRRGCSCRDAALHARGAGAAGHRHVHPHVELQSHCAQSPRSTSWCRVTATAAWRAGRRRGGGWERKLCLTHVSVVCCTAIAPLHMHPFINRTRLPSDARACFLARNHAMLCSGGARQPVRKSAEIAARWLQPTGRHSRRVPVEQLYFVDDDLRNCEDVRANCVGAGVLHVQGRDGMTAADCEAVLAWAATLQ